MHAQYRTHFSTHPLSPINSTALRYSPAAKYISLQVYTWMHDQWIQFSSYQADCASLVVLAQSASLAMRCFTSSVSLFTANSLACSNWRRSMNSSTAYREDTVRWWSTLWYWLYLHSPLSTSTDGSVVEFSPATREARVRFPVSARFFLFIKHSLFLVFHTFYIADLPHWICPVQEKNISNQSNYNKSSYLVSENVSKKILCVILASTFPLLKECNKMSIRMVA